ncbi:hypothetical protein D3C86_1933220 [compost metagenome]
MYPQAPTVPSAITGSMGARKPRFHSGCLTRSTHTPTAAMMKAKRVPMFASSATSEMGVKAARQAIATPVMMVVT